MNRIQKVSFYMLHIINILIIFLPILILLGWTFEIKHIQSYSSNMSWQSFVHTPTGYVNLNNVNWTLLTKFISLVAEIVKSLPLFFSFFVLRKIFTNYCQNRIFKVHNPRYYRHLGWLLFIDALLVKPISHALMVAAITLNNAPGHRYISINFGTPNLAEVFCGVMVIIISWIMVEATRLHDEQQFTV